MSKFNGSVVERVPVEGVKNALGIPMPKTEEKKVSFSELKKQADDLFEAGNFEEAMKAYSAAKEAEDVSPAQKGICTKQIKKCEEKTSENPGTEATATDSGSEAGTAVSALLDQIEEIEEDEVSLESVPAGTETTELSLPNQVKQSLLDFGLAPLLKVGSKDLTPEKEFEAVFKIVFALLSKAKSRKQRPSDLLRKGYYGAMRVLLGPLVTKEAGQLRRKMHSIYDAARMHPDKFKKLVEIASEFKFFYDYDEKLYREAFFENLQEEREEKTRALMKNGLEAMIAASNEKARIAAEPKPERSDAATTVQKILMDLHREIEEQKKAEKQE